MKTINNIQARLAFAILGLVSLTTSCSPVFYGNVGQNVPMFTEKGEISMTASYANSGSNEEESEAEGVSLQAAYAYNDSWAVAGSFYHLKNTPSQGWVFSAPSEFVSKGDYLEAAIGKFGQIKSNTFAYEAFAGLGYGKITNEYQGAYANVDILKPYIQPSIGFISPYVDLVLTPRIGFISYISHSSTDQVGLDAFIDQNNNKLVFEPGVTIRGGYRNLKAQVQYNYSTIKSETTFTYDGQTTTARGVNEQFISVGIYLLISERYKTD